MIFHQVKDFSDAYSNGAHIAKGERFPEVWVQPAQSYREVMTQAGRAQLDIPYGAGPREVFDLFLPQATPKGLLVFIHGGYWMSLDKSYWSHFAQGAVQQGYAVAMPSYDLCPDVHIAQITAQIGAAVTAAAHLVAGPIAITGHSAGGHLAARMVCQGGPLPKEVAARVVISAPISGLFDLRPLMATKMNETLRITPEEALLESPAFLAPLPHVDILVWVGGAERHEFQRQSQLLANIWTGLGAKTALWAEPNLHHFDVLDGLTDPAHPLVRALTGA